MELNTPLAGILRTTKEHLDALAGMGLRTAEDLLLYLPRTHEDLSRMQTIVGAPLGQKGTIRGTVDKLSLVRTRRNKYIVKGVFLDREGDRADVVWFNQPHIKRMIADGDEVVLTGKLIAKGSKLQFQSPFFEKDRGAELIHAGKLVPIYPQHDRINTKWLREKMVLVKDAIGAFPETLPADVVFGEGLLPRADTIRALHFPEDPAEVRRARERMAFEDMYRVQREALLRKREWQRDRQERLRVAMDVELIRNFFASLKFTPTNSQRVAIYEIARDMEKDRPMSRLLEGDVGSGKTLVAAAVIANVIAKGGQCALMVPTEVLAKQHADSIGRMLIGFQNHLEREKKARGKRHPIVALLTGSVPAKEARDIRERLYAGRIDLLIGTHALIEDAVRFRDLKFVIVDEQHRFGVEQRERLREKGSPHFLAMTATPIPRTLALTAYGHHDLSVLLEKPGRRQPIQTKVVSPKDRRTVELFIDKEIGEGKQVFVICPLIKDSDADEMAEVRSVEREAARLKESFPRRCIAMLHGKMTSKEKEDVMRRFRGRDFSLLVSTSVIEVGIDVPNATIILIEGSERFGLAQLHQFRGRVGRGAEKSHCFLFTTTPEQSRSARLRAMEEHDSGFLLAEIDLRIRGPGELYGTRQSGIPEMDLRGLLNPELVVRARRAAEKALDALTEPSA